MGLVHVRVLALPRFRSDLCEGRCAVYLMIGWKPIESFNMMILFHMTGMEGANR